MLQIWVQTVGKEDARKVSADRKRGIRNYSWAWNGDLLYGQDTDGDENNHLHVVNLAIERGPRHDPHRGRAGGARQASSPEVPGQVLVGMNRRDKAVFDVWRLDLATGALTPVETNPGNVGDWIVNRKLQVVGRQTNLPDGGGAIEIRDGKGWKTLRKWGVNDNTAVIAPTPDGKGLLVLTNLGHDTQVVELVDLKTGKGKVVAADPSVDATGFLYDDATDKLQAVGFKRGRLRWEVVDPSIQKDLAALAAVNGGELDVLNRDKAGKTWLVAFSSDLSPARFYAWDRASQKATFLFAARPQLEKERLAPMEVLEIKARDGLSLPAYLTLPPGVPPKDLPMVLFVHGGPWARDEWGYSSVPQWLANRGYAVLQVNYRGSTGFGKNFKNAAMKQFAAKMHDDLVDAVNWAVKTGIANPKKVAILGGSYGGYATLVGMTFTPDVFACGVDIVGPSNLVTLIESFPPYWGPFLASTWYPFVGNPKVPAEKADMEARSPLFKVGDIKKPLLIGQGANDPARDAEGVGADRGRHGGEGAPGDLRRLLRRGARLRPPGEPARLLRPVGGLPGRLPGRPHRAAPAGGQGARVDRRGEGGRAGRREVAPAVCSAAPAVAMMRALQGRERPHARQRPRRREDSLPGLGQRQGRRRPPARLPAALRDVVAADRGPVSALPRHRPRLPRPGEEHPASRALHHGGAGRAGPGPARKPPGRPGGGGRPLDGRLPLLRALPAASGPLPRPGPLRHPPRRRHAGGRGGPRGLRARTRWRRGCTGWPTR